MANIFFTDDRVTDTQADPPVLIVVIILYQAVAGDSKHI